MKNKKGEEGDILHETLGIILFALAAILIVFAAYKIYAISFGQELENAKNIIDSVEARVKAIEEGESGKFNVRGLEGWYLVGWSRDDLGKPDKCIIDSCICVCKGDSEDISESGASSIDRKFRGGACQENGLCRQMDKDVVRVIGKSYSRSNYASGAGVGAPPTRLSDDSVQEYFIELSDALHSLEVSKTASEIMLRLGN